MPTLSARSPTLMVSLQWYGSEEVKFQSYLKAARSKCEHAKVRSV